MPTAASNSSCGGQSGVRRGDNYRTAPTNQPCTEICPADIPDRIYGWVRSVVASAASARAGRAIPSENRRHLGTGNCGSAGHWQTWHRRPVAKVESAGAVAVGADAAGRGRGLHSIGCAPGWSKAGRPLRRRSSVALVCGTCTVAVCFRWMRRRAGMAGMAAPAPDDPSSSYCGHPDRSDDMGVLACFHPSSGLLTARLRFCSAYLVCRLSSRRCGSA